MTNGVQVMGNHGVCSCGAVPKNGRLWSILAISIWSVSIGHTWYYLRGRGSSRVIILLLTRLVHRVGECGVISWSERSRVGISGNPMGHCGYSKGSLWVLLGVQERSDNLLSVERSRYWLNVPYL